MPITPRTLSGFKDRLPKEAYAKSQMLKSIINSFEKFGFSPIETPHLEYAEILKKQGSDEIQKEMYHFFDHGNREVALRFDLTLPLARFISQYKNDLGLPFKRYCIGNVFRGERAQKGRYREFTQCDFDFIGTESLGSDIEILQVIYQTLSDLGLKKLLSGNYDYNDDSIKTHLRPKLFYDKWQEIINKYKINSSIDISDGLLQDTSHIAEESNKTIEIYESSNWNLVNRFFNKDNKKNNKEILKSILTGGEDYAVIFTTSDDIHEENNLIKIGKVKEYSNVHIRFIDSNSNEIHFDSLGFVHC